MGNEIRELVLVEHVGGSGILHEKNLGELTHSAKP